MAATEKGELSAVTKYVAELGKARQGLDHPTIDSHGPLSNLTPAVRPCQREQLFHAPFLTLPEGGPNREKGHSNGKKIRIFAPGARESRNGRYVNASARRRPISY
jgi:hypothetical protein